MMRGGKVHKLPVQGFSERSERMVMDTGDTLMPPREAAFLKGWDDAG